MNIRKTLSTCLILAQLTPLSTPVYATIAITPDCQPVFPNTQKVPPPVEAPQVLLSAGHMLAESNGGHYLKQAMAARAGNYASGIAADSVAGWLRQYGTAQVSLGADLRGMRADTAIDWLVPLWQSPENIVFTQQGFRSPEGHRTLNNGIGFRALTGDWMLGTNVFFDNDMTGKNRRISSGLELWHDNMRLSANSWFHLSGWHTSRDLADYDERPANGWDMRLQGWLPGLPQLGGRLIYEQYHGEGVALSDRQTRRRNPSVFSAGLSWTPFPLLTVGLDQRMPAGGAHESQLSAALRWQPGASWRTQITPESVARMHSLSGSLQDLVSRNNTVVLNYRKHTLLTLHLPARLEGESGSILGVTAQVSSAKGLESIEWDTRALEAAGGHVMSQTQNSLIMLLPVWQGSGLNRYPVSAFARDRDGHRSAIATTQVIVREPLAVLKSGSLHTIQDNSPADGISRDRVTATVTSAQGMPLGGQAVHFHAQSGMTVISPDVVTAADGTASTDLTSLKAGMGRITADLDNGQAASGQVTFSGVAYIKNGDLTVVRNGMPADGISADLIQARVTDAEGNGLSGQTIKFNATRDVLLSPYSAVTGNDGKVQTRLTGKTAGDVKVMATLADGQVSMVTATLGSFAQIASGDLSLIRNYATANGRDTDKVEVRVTDGAGRPVPGEPVSFSVSDDVNLSLRMVKTGSDGQAITELTSRHPGDVTVTARLGNGNTASIIAAFTPLKGVAFRNITVLRDRALADNHDLNRVSMTVTDGSGSPVSGQPVTFKTSDGATVFPTGQSSGTDGTVITTLHSAVAGSATLTARLSDGTTGTAKLTFIVPALIEGHRLLVTRNNAVANGNAMNAVQIRIVNGDGKPVSGQKVTFNAPVELSPATQQVITGSDGLATIAFSSTKTGKYRVKATLAATGEHAEATVTFITAEKIENGRLVVSKNNAVADGQATDSVQLRVVNSYGKAVSGQTVLFSAPSGITVDNTRVVTGSDGMATTTLHTVIDGTYPVSAKLEVTGEQAHTIVTFLTAAQIDGHRMTIIHDNSVADGKNKDTVQLRVVDGKGTPVFGQKVRFSAPQELTIVAREVTTGTDGLAKATFSSLTPGGYPVNAELNTGEAVSATIHFALLWATFQDLKAGGQQFAVHAGFPQTGFQGANFILNLPAGHKAGDYVWASSVPWITAGTELGQTGGVVLMGQGHAGEVQITATPASGDGESFRYIFRIKKWFTFNTKTYTREYNTDWCETEGAKVPGYSDMTNAHGIRQPGSRAVGALWSEWGSLDRYNAGIISAETYMAREYSASEQYSVRLTTGWIYNTALSVKNIAACITE